MKNENLIYSKVLAAFADYLKQDDCVEVVKTSRGYAVIEWDERLGSWTEIEHCPSPVALQENLLSHIVNFLEYGCNSKNRKLTGKEREQIQAQLPRSRS